MRENKTKTKSQKPTEKKKTDSSDSSNRRVTRAVHNFGKRITRSQKVNNTEFESLENLKARKLGKNKSTPKTHNPKNQGIQHQSTDMKLDNIAQRRSEPMPIDDEVQNSSVVVTVSVDAGSVDKPENDSAPQCDHHATNHDGNLPMLDFSGQLSELHIDMTERILGREELLLPSANTQSFDDKVTICIPTCSSYNGPEIGEIEENERRSLQEIIEASFSDSEFGFEKIPVDIQNIDDVINNLDDPELTISDGVDTLINAKGSDVSDSENFESINPFAIHQANSSSDEFNTTNDDKNHDSVNSTMDDGNDDTFNISNEEQDDTVNSGKFSESDTTPVTISSNLPVKTGAMDDQKLFAMPGVLKSKLSFCMYCKKLQTVISRHLETVHRHEPEVKKFAVLKKGTYERKQIIETLKNRGNNMYNTDERYNKSGELLVSRRPRERRTATEYRTCHNCRGCFSRNTIRRHFKRCVGSSSKHKRHNIILSRRIEGRLHEEACERFVKIFTVLREDEITRLIRYDELLVKFGNAMCDKYKKPQQEAMIRNRIRTLGRLLKAMKVVNPAITDFMSIYHPNLYKTMITAVKNLSDFNDETGEVENSSLAISIGIYVTAVGEFLKLLTIEKDDDAHQKLVEKYLFLHKSQYTTRVNRVALEAQSKKHRELKKPLPTTDDIRKLSDYVNENRRAAYERLKKKYVYEDWLKLLQYSLISIQIFNRRRSGEIERAEISDLKKIEKINENTNLELYNQLTEEQKTTVSVYSRFIITGKLQRDVPVLLDREMEDCLSLLLSFRQSARIPAKNPYVFGIPGFEDGRLKYLRACPLMRQYAQECGATHPERLRGTSLRKHMATTCAAQNVNENEITDIANFMGHAENIHRSHYRQSVVSRDVIGVSKLLRSAMGYDNTPVIDDANVPKVQNKRKVLAEKKNNHELDSSESSDSSVSPPKKKKKKSSILNEKNSSNSKSKNSPRDMSDKKSKKRWSQQEKDAALHAFGALIKENKLPSTSAIQLFLEKNKQVQRTIDQVRTWASNEKKKWQMEQ